MMHIVSMDSYIAEDSYKDGEGDSTGCGLQDEKIGRDFGTMKDLAEWMHDNYGMSDKPEDYDDTIGGQFCVGRMVADHGQEQNGGWMEPTKEERAAWKKGKCKLYSETFTIYYHHYTP